MRGKEQHADSVAARVGQGDSCHAANATQKSVRHLEQDTGTVAGAGVGSDSAPVREVMEDLERLVNDVAGANPVDMGDEANSARVVLVSRVVQSLLFRHRLSRSVRSC